MKSIFVKARHLLNSDHLNKDWIIYLCVTLFYPFFIFALCGIFVEVLFWFASKYIWHKENIAQYFLFLFFILIGAVLSAMNVHRWRKYEREKRRKERGQ